ncbi:class I SAM-dependent methyltransferase [Oscillibacter sp.]|uniref:tRNA (adenine(22)-N(1))-methyltransferase n=1 Tax=Oscillibacter sp. TaxID=1945593 RepID=UPI0028AC01D2|nr:class I SAM-dependent methyltransferase [Oscillibacter sp.]
MNTRKPELSTRLHLLADWVPQGAALVDVGTDHAYLPVRLALEGRLRFAIACDLRPGPLSRGQDTARRFGVLEQIDFRLCDGLAGVGAKEVDTVVIAGMGGENIVSILAAAPWTADSNHILLLQPQSRAEELRAFLIANGYAICREQLVEDRGTIYPVLKVRPGHQDPYPGQIYGGAHLMGDPLGGRYLVEQILRLQTAVAGLNRGSGPETSEKADRLRDVIASLMVLWEEWRHANGS